MHSNQASKSPTTQNQVKNSQPTQASTSAASRGVQLKKSASQAGDFATQEAALSPRNPVQRKGDGGKDGVHAAAARGISGGGGTMPFASQIQASFGSHDVSRVEAHTDSAAAEGSAAMGADAYATGDHVAFKGQPDLHTAAHEAAHVVQQKAGVQLSGGVGQVGDAYEKQADEVADRVVQGKSAEDLLGSKGQAAGTQAVQKAGEEEGRWLQQQTLTKDSFFDLIRQNLLAAESWQTKAAVEDPPPLWQTALMTVGGLVLNAALGGVGAALAGKLVDSATKFAASTAINAAIEFGKAAAGKGVDAAISAASGAGDKKPLVAFCEQQKTGLSASSKKAREEFVLTSGTHTDQRLTIGQMKQIQTANDEAFTNATSIQHHEMLVGWMGMNAGDTTNSKTLGNDVESFDNNGVLRIKISGVSDSPVMILGASVEGLNNGLRADIAGSKLREWRKGAKDKNGKAREQGIDVVVTTGNPDSVGQSFQVSSSTWARLTAAGQAPSSATVSGNNKSVYFSFLAERTGKMSWIDQDMNWSVDFNWGADAGRWFLKNVKSWDAVLAELDNLTLPSSIGG